MTVAAIGVLVFNITENAQTKQRGLRNLTRAVSSGLLSKLHIKFQYPHPGHCKVVSEIKLPTYATATSQVLKSWYWWQVSLICSISVIQYPKKNAIPFKATVLDDNTSMSMISVIRGEYSQTCHPIIYKFFHRRSNFIACCVTKGYKHLNLLSFTAHQWNVSHHHCEYKHLEIAWKRYRHKQICPSEATHDNQNANVVCSKFGQ